MENVVLVHEGQRLEVSIEDAKKLSKELFIEYYGDLFQKPEEAYKAFTKAFDKTDVKK